MTATSLTERWTSGGPVRVHYVELDAPTDARTPVVFVPGFGEEAAEHEQLLDRIAPRRALAVDLRGRGRSDVPSTGYRLEDHVQDLDAVVTEAGLDRVHLVSYSRGTTYALAWALANPQRVASVSIGDYPALQIVPPVEIVEMAARRTRDGRPLTDRMVPRAIVAMLADAEAKEFWDDLPMLTCPMLLVRGGRDGAMASATVEERYRSVRPDIEVEVFEQSAHDLWNPDADRFASTVRDFLDRVDPGTPG